MDPASFLEANKSDRVGKVISKKHVEDRFYAVIDLNYDDLSATTGRRDSSCPAKWQNLFLVVLQRFAGLINKLQLLTVDWFHHQELWEKAKKQPAMSKIDEKDLKLYTSSKLAAAKTKPEEAKSSLSKDSKPRVVSQSKFGSAPFWWSCWEALIRRALANTEISTFFAGRRFWC